MKRYNERPVKGRFCLICNTFLLQLFIMAQAAFSQSPSLGGADGLGRVLVQNDEAGALRKDAKVGLFYFLWQGDPTSQTSANHWDLNELWKKHPEVFEDADHPLWGGGTGKYYFWGEPVYGYYRGDDYWVHLKNIQLLADARVDFLVIDATNDIAYPAQSHVLMKAMEAVNSQGINAPKIVFYTNTNSGKTMQTIYDSFYKEGAPFRHPDCWFMLDGKPLIIGVSQEAEGKDYRSFFTIRESQWPTVPEVINGWPWIEFVRPQKVYKNDRGEKEIINVSVAQHPNPSAGMGGSAFYGNRDNWGRSYHDGKLLDQPEKEILYGSNFQEQWEVALRERPPFVFITGWNEWIAGKWPSHDSNPEHSWFCDQASPEYSRDIEPTLTAGLKDHYYMQMVNNIRRYKGVDPILALSPMKTIRNLDDWKDVFPLYKDYTGDVIRRNHPGAQSAPVVNYVNETGRNDFSILKIARNRQAIYFYAETCREITKPAGDNWMTLYIDTDRSHLSGWNGYDFRILSGNRLQAYRNGRWKDVGRVNSVVEGNRMMITVPVGRIKVDPAVLDLEFKWCDNWQSEDPMDWYVNGDTAPGGRFNYVARSRNE